jgi:ribosomal protein S18 acetylase RimI-like enzyme
MRRASAADATAIVELVESAYRGEASRRGWTTEADLLDGQRVDLSMVTETLADPAAVVLVAVEAVTPRGHHDLADAGTGAEGRELVGCCEVRADGAGEASFGMFAVDPERQGGGLGAALLEAAEQLAATELGAGHMTMSVIDARAELVAWYERKGYRRTGELRPFPYGDERFGRPRRDDLRFAVLAKELPVGDDGPPRSQSR